MSPATKMLSVTTPLMSKARQPASQPTPQKPAASPAPSSHSMLRIDPSDATHHVDVERGPVGELGTPHVSVRVALQRRHPDAGAQVDAVVPLHLGGDLADHAAERADERRLAALGDGHGEVELAADRGHLRADEAGADDQDPPRPGGQRLLQPAASSRVRIVNTPSSAASAGLNHGRARMPVAISSRSYGTWSPLASRTCLVSRSRPVAATPSRHSASIARTRGSLVWSAGTHPFSTCFESGGRSYGSCGSSPMMVSVPAEALVAQRFGGAQPGQRGADDDDPAGGLERPRPGPSTSSMS